MHGIAVVLFGRPVSDGGRAAILPLALPVFLIVATLPPLIIRLAEPTGMRESFRDAGAAAIDEACTRRNHGGMKRIVLALFLALALPASAQTPPADWRAIVSERDRARIENWRANFERAVELADQAPPIAWHGISRDELRSLVDTEAHPFALGRIEGRWRCRIYAAGRNHVGRYDWFHCRVYRDGLQWRIEKRSGQDYFGGTFYPDPVLGTVFVGADWASGQRTYAYGQHPNRDTVGVLRRAGNRLLRLILSYEDYLQVVEIDIRYRLRARHLTAPGAKADSD
jgi:Domain of unknown function (DUF4893)